MLSITGAEAMYADLGHFSQRSIMLSFLFFVYPCLLFTYMGQVGGVCACCECVRVVSVCVCVNGAACSSS